MWLPLLGLVIGVVLGQSISLPIPAIYAKYTGLATLAALDSILGSIYGLLTKKYSGTILLTGFFTNCFLAASLAYLGDMMGLPDLYYAAIFVFGVRLFQNLAIVRRYLLLKYFDQKTKAHTLIEGVVQDEQ